MFKLRPYIASCFAALFLTLLCSCGDRSETPAAQQAAPAPAASAEAPKPKKAPGKFVNDIPKWKAYRRYVRTGEYERAKKAQKTIKAAIPGKALRREFYEEMLPSSKRIKIQIVHLCPVCSDGSCGKCGGDGLCSSCKGSLNCNRCGGVGEKNEPCAACSCKGCNATGICQKCLSKGKQTCSVCKGKLKSFGTKDRACGKCGGKGKIVTKGMSGQMTQTCPDCKGKGKFILRTSKKCAACKGYGHEQCSTCKGSGRCAKCDGNKTIEGCSLCRDSGTVTTVCIKCKGSKECQDCKGWRRCGACEGEGVCGRCLGKRLVEIQELLARKSWLKSAEGCLLQDGSRYSARGGGLVQGEDGVVFVSAKDAGSLKRDAVSMDIELPQKTILCIGESEDTAWIKSSLLK